MGHKKLGTSRKDFNFAPDEWLWGLKDPEGRYIQVVARTGQEAAEKARSHLVRGHDGLCR